MKLAGKKALITGASQGLGLVIAQAYIREGASVCICARNEAELAQAAQKLQASAPAGVKVIYKAADVSDEAQIKALVQMTLQTLGGLDILVSNAGIYGPMGPLEETDFKEWVRAVEINLMGTAIVCKETISHFKKQRSGKMILLSGGGATKPMPFLSSYASSKAAVVRFGETLAVELEGTGIDVNLIAPGALNTRLLDEAIEAGPDKIGQAYYDQCVKQRETGGHGLERGAELSVYLGSSQSNGVTGRLISAIWDPWESLHEHSKDLKNSDIYTLRRITPADRGKKWGERETK